MFEFSVSITESEGLAVNIDVIYQGDNFDLALRAASAARGEPRYRGKWLRLDNRRIDNVRWIQLF